MQPEIRTLKQNHSQMEEKVAAALKQSQDDNEASSARIAQLEETIAIAVQSLAEQKEVSRNIRVLLDSINYFSCIYLNGAMRLGIFKSSGRVYRVAKGGDAIRQGLNCSR